MTATSWPGLVAPVVEAVPSETLDQAHDLGDLSTTPRAEAIGTLGQGPAGAADVDWYRFTLDRAAGVKVMTPDRPVANSLASVVTLYNSDEFDFNDFYDLLGHYPLSRSISSDHADAQIERQLGPGTYYVAISGKGNQYFHPFLAGSGYPGSTGDFGLLITAVDLGLDPATAPAVLATEPATNAVLDRSPFLIRLDLSAPLDPSTLAPGLTVSLTYNPAGAFGDGNDQDVALAGVNFSSAANELQLQPGAPLAPGSYKVFLAGDSSSGQPVLADPTGIPLGSDADYPLGRDFSFTFQVAGSQGNTAANAGADDTPATAHDLADVTHSGLVQVGGAIGTDPTDPVPWNSAGVEMYHFKVSGTGHFALTAEAFAGRIGSPLDSGLSLFQMGSDNLLHLLADNDNSTNPTQTSNGLAPLYTDAILFTSLTAGDYYLVVSSAGNVPDVLAGQLPGTNGVFDPNLSHSGQIGFSTGPYVLNLQVRPDNDLPQVVNTSLTEGASYSAAPTGFKVKFSESVNLQQLAYEASVQVPQGTVTPVFIVGSDGTKHFPRLVSYDPATNVAAFLMLDRLPGGANELHLSGSLGLTDGGSNLLVGNDPGGDYVVHFSVDATTPDSPGNPLLWTYQEPVDASTHTHSVGTLFPLELQTGVVLERDLPQDQTEASTELDAYQFQVLQSTQYEFTINGPTLPADVQIVLTDSTGNPVPDQVTLGSGNGLLAHLDPGTTYTIRVSNWLVDQAAGMAYQIGLALGVAPDWLAPLTSGASPAIRIQLASAAPATPPPTIVRITPPASTPAPDNSPLGPVAKGTAPTGSSITGDGQATSAGGLIVSTTLLTFAPRSTSGPASNEGGALIRSDFLSSRSLGLTASGGAATASTTPPSLLLAVGAGPLGGVRDVGLSDKPVTPDRILVRNPETQPALTQVEIVAHQASGAQENHPASESIGNGPVGIVSEVSKLLGEAASAVSRSWDRLPEVLAAPSWKWLLQILSGVRVGSALDTPAPEDNDEQWTLLLAVVAGALLGPGGRTATRRAASREHGEDWPGLAAKLPN